MQITYIGSTWGLDHLTLDATLRLIRESGFDGVEMGVPADPTERKKFRGLIAESGLALVAQQWTAGATPEEHASSFEEQYRRSAELRPLLVNSHTGKDHYTLSENLVIFKRAAELEKELGVPIAHETHRGRAPYSTVSTMALLDALPGMNLTADFSHWCCVHESLLDDQVDRLKRAIERTIHIHARIGHAEGPQVSEPRAPEWKDAVEAHLRWWQHVVDYRSRSRATFLTITPEFGPPPYMITQPYTMQPMVSNWEVNKHMKDLLRTRLTIS